ncbi:hypothetical protein STVIR_4095 [Streptomyces viridochromogenes Tue57]|uniref:Uncharacterized protein n=1 Tax=Streptomyces viridochromogenes Tue57 TaxID=1160705 RepID=L8PFB3_STRVR|nr:hypothetical protein STVIR_4095 [Streptomyces viridochromogenes Tue57]
MLVCLITAGPCLQFGIRARNARPCGDELRILEEYGSGVRGQKPGEAKCLGA